MLQTIRDKAQGWIAWAIVILISIPFALWGIQEYLGVGAEPVVATVNGNDLLERDLDRRARDFRENLRVTLGAAYRPDLIGEEDLRAQVRERMIDERVMLDAAREWGMRAGDDLVRRFIQSIPGFQQDGTFSQGIYDTVLRNRGMTPPMFEESVRQDLLLNQVRAAVRGSALVTERALAEAARLEYQQRDLAYVLISANRYKVEVAVAEEALEGFYRENADAFMVPEKVSVQYLMLDVASLAKTVPVDERQLEQYYTQHAIEFRVPEQRRVRHILVAVPANADDAAQAEALAEAQALRQRLAGGEDFAAVAREASADPGSAQNGGDLGWIEPGMMVAPFNEAAFALPRSEVSEPIRSQFGFHLIEVTEVRAGDEGDLESVRDEVEASYRRTEAELLFYDYAERLAELAFENPGSLAPAAEALGLALQTTALFSRDEPPAELQDLKVVNAAFSPEVLERGNNSELLELDPAKALVLRVLEHEPEHLRPLAEVRDEVVERYRAMRAAEAATQEGQAALQQLGEGQALGALAESKGWKLERVAGVRRDDSRLPAPLVAKAFELPPPEPGAHSRGGVKLGEDFAVVEVHGVQDATLGGLSENDKRLLRNRLQNQAETGEFNLFLTTLRSEAEIEIRSTP